MRLKFDDLDSRVELSAISSNAVTTTFTSSSRTSEALPRNIVDRSISVSRPVKQSSGSTRSRSQSRLRLEALYAQKKSQKRLFRSRLSLYLITGFNFVVGLILLTLGIDYSHNYSIALWIIGFIGQPLLLFLSLSQVFEKFLLHISASALSLLLGLGLPLCYFIDEEITDGPVMMYFILSQILALCVYSFVSTKVSIFLSWLMLVSYGITALTLQRYQNLQNQLNCIASGLSLGFISTVVLLILDNMLLEDEAFEDHNSGIIRSMYQTIKSQVETQTIEFNADPPMVSILDTLRKLCMSPGLTDDEASEIQQVIQLLQSSADIFSPMINESANGEPQYVDPDTHNLLVSFVGPERGGTYLGSFAASHAMEFVKSSSGSPIDHSSYSSVTWRSRAISMHSKKSLSSRSRSRSKRSWTQAEKIREGFMQSIQEHLSSDPWSLDTIELSASVDGRPLQHVAYYYLESLQIISSLNIPLPKLMGFLAAIERCYIQNPYHNAIHAADVVNSFCYLLNPSLLTKYNDLEIFAAILAAIIHDVEHDGRTNAFHINSASTRALLHNDRSVQEHHHLSTAFRILYQEENNILQHLPVIERKSVRDIVIDLVLATDMAKHFELVNLFKNKVGGQGLNLDDREDKLLMLKILLKCADIGHSAKRLEVHEKWSARITEEFYQQVSPPECILAISRHDFHEQGFLC
eukprot:TRINITY_DN8580_c0_g1_i2.p1 TRINITY_DN8580_c0_g1~~TRINITY_DN8580_c0_g1_i2.p1  ORF type:complete len:693 (+),score=111.05 TRINITY_DN8580_c0_g1_i2:123-2201(+)